MQLTPGQAVNLPFDAFASSDLIQSRRLPAYRWYQLKPAAFNGSFI